ncbi:hypothetical protein O5344_11430 [Escherichia coli]|nr:hypothetical protein [Escherichia coli]MCZ5508185.1 hypothetical protein [Escherichia coli]MCZ5962529.1 hypothetical protein [Escherichia coli]MDC9145308.1 hypothetical protein [Escherichia coli]
MTHEINPTGVLDVITEGTGQRSYTPLQGWRLEVCSPAILINGQEVIPVPVYPAGQCTMPTQAG